MVYFDDIKNRENIYLYAGDIDIKTKLGFAYLLVYFDLLNKSQI